LTRWSLVNWPIAAGLISLAMLGAAHGFETFGHLPPCHLCLKQREVYWAALAVSAALMLGAQTPLRARLRVPGALLLAAIFAFGAGLAAYHAGVEWKFWPGPASCTSSGSMQVSVQDISKLLRGDALKAPQCDKAAWVFLGLSMAGWNAIVSLGLAGISLMSATLGSGKNR